MPKHAIETIVNETISNTSAKNISDIFGGCNGFCDPAPTIFDFFHNLWMGLFPAICVVFAIIWVIVFCFTSFNLIRHCIKEIILWIKNRKQKRR